MTSGWETIDVQIAWDDNPLVWAPTWNSVQADVIDITVTRGRNSELDHYAAGTCTVVLDDADGDYQPLNATGPHAGDLRPYRQLRVVANDSTSTQRTLFRGHVNPRGWQSQPRLPGDAEMTVAATDIFAMLARFDLAEADPPVDAGHTTADRFGEVALNQAGLGLNWILYLGAEGDGRLLDATRYGTKALAYLQLLADSEGGALWVRNDGVLICESRLNVFLDTTRTTVQGTFSDDGNDIAYQLDGIVPDYAQDVINRARMGRAGGTVQEVTDSTSITSLTGTGNTLERTDLLLANDPDAYSLAELIVTQFKDEWYGPAELTFDAGASNGALDMALLRDLRHRVKVEYTPPSCAQSSTECFVERIVHRIPVRDRPRAWDVTFGLSSAQRLAAFVGADFLVFDGGGHTWKDSAPYKKFAP